MVFEFRFLASVANESPFSLLAAEFGCVYSSKTSNSFVLVGQALCSCRAAVRPAGLFLPDLIVGRRRTFALQASP